MRGTSGTGRNFRARCRDVGKWQCRKAKKRYVKEREKEHIRDKWFGCSFNAFG
jgi:hypothetical protein